MNNPAKYTIFLIVACIQVSAVAASEVFTWKDADGVTHYSQWAPDDVSKVSTLIVHSKNEPGYVPQEDPYSINNQARRMNETWKSLEARRKERQEEKLEAQKRSYVPEQPQYEHRTYFAPPWYYRPVYPPAHRPKPPIHRPPHVRPGQPRRSAAPRSFTPDPMRSAHIGVRRSTNTVPVSVPR